MVELAHVIGPSDGDTKLSTSRLRRILTHGPIADPSQTSAEDPSEETFVSCIQFFGGNYRVLSGGATGAHVGCQLVLEATRYMGELGHENFETTVFLEAQALLTLSEEACRRAGLARWAAPADTPRSALFVPEGKALDQLRAAVVFTPEECRELIGADLAAVIESMTLDSRVAPPDDDRESPVDDRLYGLPLGRTRDGNVVLALPGGVTMSIVHRTAVRALDKGIVGDFVDCLRRAQIDALHRAFTSMRWERVGTPDDLEAPTGFAERFYRFDVDKLAHVCSVVDTLDGYEAGSPFDFAPMTDVVEELRTRLPAVRAAFRVSPDRGSVLHLVALAPLGRSHALRFLGNEIDGESELVLANLGDFVVIAGEVDADPLGLWAFARAQRRLHERAHVVSFSVLDEYAIYKGHSDGFYLGDDQHPTMVSVQSDTGAPLRIESAQRRDVHAVVLPDSDRVGLVERWRASTEQPIYRPLSGKHNACHLVEGSAPVWIVPVETNGPERQHAEDLVETVAFWIWRCSDFLSDPLRSLSEHGVRPVIEVHAAVPDPTASSDLEPLSGWLEVESTASGRIVCRFGEGAGSRFSGPGNAAERIVARTIVAALYRLAGLIEPPADAWPEVLRFDSLVKMLHVLGPDADPMLTLALGAQPRLVRSSAVEMVLDDLGEQLSEGGIAVGAVDASSRTNVLNQAVAWAFGEMWSLLQAQHPAGLLEVLALETESIIYAEARAKLQVPSQAACFGAESAAVARSKTYITGMASTAIANRFIVEMVTASPPNGRERFSLENCDRLIALANQIVEFGFLSDAIQYGLSDVRMAFLPSGRLGLDRANAFQTALSSFGEIAKSSAMASAFSAYATHWRSNSSGGRDARGIDAAYEAEFGISATSLTTLIGDLVQQARDADHGVAARDLAELEAALAESTGLTDNAVAAGLGLLSLEPIAGFDPNRVPRDSYPWKFSRNRSMLRRPLLVHPTTSGREVVWGARATWRAGRYLLQQLVSARYPATSNQMRTFVSTLTQQAGEEFNASVANALRELGFDDVRERVKKIGKLRLLRTNGQDMGDVDVLVIDRSRRVLVVVEAKDFEFARTPQELGNEVEKLIGERGSASTHHLERVGFLRDQLPRVLKELGISDDPVGWDVQGMVVTSSDLLGTHYLRASGLARELRLISLEALRERRPSQLVTPLHRKNPAKAEKRQRRKRRKRR
ncbi:MAG: hypothetical protein FGM29_08495 [Actinobacteria bacterium]|nr:hypothetical protein [Actinomycetota bacterium]